MAGPHFNVIKSGAVAVHAYLASLIVEDYGGTVHFSLERIKPLSWWWLHLAGVAHGHCELVIAKFTVRDNEGRGGKQLRKGRLGLVADGGGRDVGLTNPFRFSSVAQMH